MEKSWGPDDQVDQNVASPQPAARHDEPAQVFPANGAPVTGDRGWMAVGWFPSGRASRRSSRPQEGDDPPE
jgi:hypothetical protein